MGGRALSILPSMNGGKPQVCLLHVISVLQCALVSHHLIGTIGVLKRRFVEHWHAHGFLRATGYMMNLGFSVLLTPWFKMSRGRRTFAFRGRNFPYFIHWYNATFDNERALEIPLALHAIRLAGAGKVLEIGNVLSHYTSFAHDILDKYECGKDVIHEDVVSFIPASRYDLIISLSTLEHVGFDEEPKEPAKIIRAVQNLRSCLAPGGRIVATIPVGYNPHITPLLRSGELFDAQHYFARVSATNVFREVSKEEALSKQFNTPFTFGNGIVIGLIGPWPEQW